MSQSYDQSTHNGFGQSRGGTHQMSNGFGSSRSNSSYNVSSSGFGQQGQSRSNNSHHMNSSFGSQSYNSAHHGQNRTIMNEYTTEPYFQASNGSRNTNRYPQQSGFGSSDQMVSNFDRLNMNGDSYGTQKRNRQQLSSDDISVYVQIDNNNGFKVDPIKLTMKRMKVITITDIFNKLSFINVTAYNIYQQKEDKFSSQKGNFCHELVQDPRQPLDCYENKIHIRCIDK